MTEKVVLAYMLEDYHLNMLVGNGHGTARKKMSRREDKANGCCEQRHETGGTGKEDSG